MSTPIINFLLLFLFSVVCICLYWESFLKRGFLIWELIFIADLCPHLVSLFCFFLFLFFFFFFLLHFGQISPLAVFRWLTATSDRNAESYMESRNFWGYGYKTQHSYTKTRLITWRWPEVKFGRNVVRKTPKKNTKMRTKVPNKN